MNAYDFKNLLDNLETARIYAGAEFERLCNNNKHIDACVFQSVRDSIAQNIQLLRSYAICMAESEDKQTDGDLISRESVITMLNKIENAVEDGDGFQFNEWVEYAKDIPSAEKTAEWVYRGNSIICSSCGEKIPYGIHNHYCRNCGAKMKGVE